LLIARLAGHATLPLHRVPLLIARLAAQTALSLHGVPLRRVLLLIAMLPTLLSTVLPLVHPILVRAPVRPIRGAAILRVPVLRAGLGLTVRLRLTVRRRAFACRILDAHASSASPLPLEVLRDGKSQTFTVALGEMSNQ
jgi:hypothetical protein